MDDRPLAVTLMGPTASGKSALAMALAARLPLEIVSVDSAQVYRGMDIGTAKPAATERARVPHHLIDLIDPTEAYSAARFREDALAAVRAIASRGRLPLLTGGTMLYFKALRDGLSELPAAVPEVRAVLDAQAVERGWPALHAELARIDPATAERLAPTDAQRIQRALEVHRVTGRTLTELQGTRASTPLRLLQIGLVAGDRDTLHRRIATRFEAMLAAGLLDELRGLRARHALNATLPSMRCVGYRQAWQVLEGEIAPHELRDRGIYATRQLAKRQLTWLRTWPDAALIDCLAPDIENRAIAALRAGGVDV